jgi:hypothetical protein
MVKYFMEFAMAMRTVHQNPAKHREKKGVLLYVWLVVVT